MADWKDTCNLPRTSFSMKANLQTTEPETVARWDAIDLYGQIRAARKGAKKFLLHDGPPYANGNIHIGHALNKILKDLVVKSHNMMGFDAPYIPGWDCHGLPIELRVDRELGPKKRQMSTADFRRECQAYAAKYLDIQRDEFKRLGVIGEWDEPYKTMNHPYQAAIVRALGKFVEQDMVYKGKKPVHWCTHCRTALAEAEVEYEPHTSPSIYVEFPLEEQSVGEFWRRVAEGNPAAVAGLPTSRPVSALIWTTTPWTIPSNLGIAFHPDFEYGVYDVSTSAEASADKDGKAVIIAKGLAESVSQKTGRAFTTPLATFEGKTMERLVFRHPLYDRASLAVLGDYVTLEAGTGAVHTAPGHGADDYHTGVKYGLEIYAPLDPGGHYNESVELFAGLKVWDANPKVEAALKERGFLWSREDFSHSYPHCWRCHHPVIFLATAQWFIRLDGEPAIQAMPGEAGEGRRAEVTRQTLREAALDAIRGQVRWIPSWGHDRIYNMLANRPDWCISRQRAWGVPIPAVDCTKCGEAILTPALVEKAAAVFDVYGADAWYERPLGEFIPEGLACSSCGGDAFERERDILDVWFDSGSSHEAVLPFWPDLTWPADMYLEGSDQHRGWFQSSLLVALGTRGRPPFRQVLTHGFLIDVDGRKMSKSIGNTIRPQEVIKESGAEILRLWVAMSDYSEELRVGKEILARAVEAYRKIRNTMRYLIANLYDFDPATDLVPLDNMEEVDRFILARYGELARKIVQGYDAYDYPTIFQELNAFMTVDLSALYNDISKDRLYTFRAQSRERRSAQSAMYTMADGLTRLLAPILPVTADELWRNMPGPAAGRDESVHLALFPADAELQSYVDRDVLKRWAELLAIREAVTSSLEILRKDKRIGNSLQARVGITATGADLALLERYREQLPMLFIVSQVEVASGGPATAEPDPARRGHFGITVDRVSGVKCDRCWRYVPAVATDPAWAGLCERCQEALAQATNA